ncbi:MAG: hypothetical protein LC749_08340, partial [Actinobacteria bacterium]|nr:hypothetical protein [Actinomycetota bacterium]
MRPLALLIALLALAGCSSTSQGQRHVPVIPQTSAAPPAPATLPRLRPVSVDVPAINAHSSLIPLGLNPDHTMATPDDAHPKQAGYYCVTDPATLCSAGVLPGQVGPAVI